MILVDANILMYAAGADHPNKDPSLRFLESVAAGDTEGVLDAEVLQEVLHRYRAIHRWEAGRSVYDHARQIFSVVLPITAEVLDIARLHLDAFSRISARDAPHAAVAETYEVDLLCSYDRGFDAIAGLHRVGPEDVLSG